RVPACLVERKKRRVPVLEGVTDQGIIIGSGTRPHDRRSRLLPCCAALTFLVERVAKPADDEAAHRRRVAEPHFGLRRVNVYVDLLEWNFDKQGRDRVTVAR